MLAADVLPKVAADICTCSLSRRRAQLAEAAFLDIAEILSSAPDPTPPVKVAIDLHSQSTARRNIFW